MRTCAQCKHYISGSKQTVKKVYDRDTKEMKEETVKVSEPFCNISGKKLMSRDVCNGFIGK